MITALRTDTAEAGFPWALPALPSVPTRHLTLHARARRARSRFAASAFVADVTHGTRRSMAILGALGALYVAVAVVRGIYVVTLTIRSHPVLLDLLAAVVIGAVFLAVSFAVYLRAADKGLEK